MQIGIDVLTKNEYPHLMLSFTNKNVRGVRSSEVQCSKNGKIRGTPKYVLFFHSSGVKI